MISVDEALAHIFALLPEPTSETVVLPDAAGRVLAAPLTAGHSQPPFDASAMDGYAVRAADLRPGVPLRMIGAAQAGQRFAGMINAGQCVRIFTGAPMPIGADTVVIQEDAIANGNEITFTQSPPPGSSVRRRGSVYNEGQSLLGPGTVLTPARLALAASANRSRLSVARRPRIAVLATGDELVAPGQHLGPDQIAASNSYGLAPLLSPFAHSIDDLGIVRDDPVALAATLDRAFGLGIDLLVTTGGASVGERDYVQDALIGHGVTLEFWKIAMRPGKPLMFGTHGSTLIFGLPGNPVSALVTAITIVLPALRQMLGQLDPLGTRLRLPLAAPLPANGSRRHFIRAHVEPAPGGSVVLPFAELDSGHIASLAAADGLIVQPENAPAIPAGEVVDFIPF